jgi:K+-transporting ATPase ATPase B chain
MPGLLTLWAWAIRCSRVQVAFWLWFTAKYFAIIPAMFILAFPQLAVLNIMRLATPQSAILSAVIFNAVIIIALIPLALRGITYKPLRAAAILRRNLLIYGVGGVILRSSGSRRST